MAKLVHDVESERTYKSGVSECVLFVKNEAGTGYEKGVAWNGIKTITLSPEGAEESIVYADNIPYLRLRSPEELKATIEACDVPEAFDVCDGTAQVMSSGENPAPLGMKVTQQKRRGFAFCYKQKKCTALDEDAGYILHIVYGCSAAPAEDTAETINDSTVDPSVSYEISCTKVDVTGYKPTAHIELDSTVVNSTKMTAIINALYGTDGADGAEGTDPTLKTPDQIISMLTAA